MASTCIFYIVILSNGDFIPVMRTKTFTKVHLKFLNNPTSDSMRKLDNYLFVDLIILSILS